MKRLLLASLLAGVAFAASAQSVGTTIQPTVQDDIHSDAATRDVRDHDVSYWATAFLSDLSSTRSAHDKRLRPSGRG